MLTDNSPSPYKKLALKFGTIFKNLTLFLLIWHNAAQIIFKTILTDGSLSPIPAVWKAVWGKITWQKSWKITQTGLSLEQLLEPWIF